LESTIYRRLGAYRRDVIVGPRFGVDNAVVRTGEHRVLVATADPLSYIPSLGVRDSAWLSVNLIASDLATSGLAPQYGIFDFNLPPRMSPTLFADYWRYFHEECRRLGLAVVGGHTGRYQGCDYTIIGAGVMYATGSERQYLTSAMGQPGDDIVLTKGAAIETTAVLARAFPKTVRKAIGDDLFKKARAYLSKVTTITDSLTAITVGLRQNGITAMHDATEGGVVAAILELAHASNVGVELELPTIHVSPETEQICRAFRVDPLNSLSEGSLIVACRPVRTAKLMSRLQAAKIDSCVIGRLTRKRVFSGVNSNGMRRTIRYPRFDPYWRAYWKATSKNWT
jgi:hydrogenase expression/formation protein HypE